MNKFDSFPTAVSHCLCREIKQSRLAANLRPNLAFEKESHDVIMSVLLVAIFTSATASVAEVMLLARESPDCTLVGNLRLFAGALATISLLSILDPIPGCITSAVWTCLFMAVAYESRTELGNILRVVTDKLIDMFTRLAASVRSREEEPNQPRV
ncbi:hypothetical protein DKX38_019459 [Salix brachista]|uniref:Uncharacterized protein n=1 Tax=Salix brachista TaxID=2182728 RepID=A0A5N5KGI9_9ROSI|nr:hypothetical protein DKX38_019459 [Salix brachista]